MKMIQMRRSTRCLWCLLTAVMMVCAFGSSAIAALPEPQAEICFLTLSGDTLTIRQGGVQTGSFAVGGEGFDIAFYRYEPTGQLCVRFTDKNGDDRKIALGTSIQLALSGTFDTITLNASLGDTRFYLKSDASVETFNLNFSGTAFIYGRAGHVAMNGPAVASLQRNAEVGLVSLNNRGAALKATFGSNVPQVNRIAGGRAESPSSSRSDGNRRDDENYITGVSIVGDMNVGKTVNAQVSYRYAWPYGRAGYQWYVRTSAGSVYPLSGETDSSLYIDGTDVKVGDEVRVRVEGKGDTGGSAFSDWYTVQSLNNKNYITGVSIVGDVSVGKTVDAQVSYRYAWPYGRAGYQWFVRTSGGMSALGGETDSSLYIDGTDVKAGDEVRVRVEGKGDTSGNVRSDWYTVQSRQVIISGSGTMTDRIGDNVMYTITAQGVPDATSLKITWDREPAASVNIERFLRNEARMTITANALTVPGSYRFSASVLGYTSAQETLTIGSSSVS
ncbi:hypothetical protein [Harryflintia acetispora]|nr:hypothetical protein [Harryflintia acetispora]